MIALLLLFTVYPHNINYQNYKHYKNKKLVSTPTHPTIIPFIEERERVRERV
jgi:hypothetical protein